MDAFDDFLGPLGGFIIIIIIIIFPTDDAHPNYIFIFAYWHFSNSYVSLLKASIIFVVTLLLLTLRTVGTLVGLIVGVFRYRYAVGVLGILGITIPWNFSGKVGVILVAIVVLARGV